VIGRANQRGRIRIGAWALIAALLPCATCWAADQPSTPPTDSGSPQSTTSQPATARPKVPSPQTRAQAGGPDEAGVGPNSALFFDPARLPSRAFSQRAQWPSLMEFAPAGGTPPLTGTASTENPLDVTHVRPTVARPSQGGPTERPDSRPQEDSSNLQATGSSSGASALAPPLPQEARPEKSDAQELAESLFLAAQDDPAESNPLEVRSWMDGQVARTGCSTCGGYHTLDSGPAFHESMGCDGGSCIPGRKPCYPPASSSNTFIGAFCQNLYQCLCCPDPCYQPQWVPAANASLFADYARPRTVTRLRYDNLQDMTRPDQNQFWIQGVSLTRTNPNHPRSLTNPFARIQQFYLYQEVAGPKGSFFIEYPYRQINQSWAPTQAGFGNLNFGIKSLMFDCELLQVAFQFRTYTPTGNASLNLGNGLFALDPSILAALKLGPETYFQAQFGNWIPLGGNSKLAGGMFYSLMSLNHVVAYVTPDSPLIATLEMDAWSFENGGYTAGISPSGKSIIVEKGGGSSYFNIGPGLRQSICNRVDLGAAITWATSTAHWAQPWFRFEARFLF
jgi:hypothetical protein